MRISDKKSRACPSQICGFQPFLFCHTRTIKAGTRRGTHQKLTPDCTTGKMQALLFLMALLLPSVAGAEEIIGAVEAKPHSHLYMAHLEIFHYHGRTDSCGGVLITRQFVLSAAHCKGREITVTLGAHDVSKRESTQQKIKVKKQIVHKNYIFSNLHDIMLLKLIEQAELTSAMDVISLPGPPDFIIPKTMYWAAGWG